MGYSNGLLEQSEKSGKGEPGIPGIGFLLTDDGNFDINDIEVITRWREDIYVIGRLGGPYREKL